MAKVELLDDADGHSRRRPPSVSRRAIRPSTILTGLSACVAAIILAASGSGPSLAAAPTTTRPVAPTSTTPPSTRVPAKVLAAYRTMWADLVTAAETSDYQSPLLPQHASGAALSLLVQGLARDQLHGIVTRGTTVHHPQVTSLSPAGNPTHATIVDCFDDTHWLEYTTAGGLAKNVPGGRRATTAYLVTRAGTWKVSRITIQATGTC